jgi:hypothetical protein
MANCFDRNSWFPIDRLPDQILGIHPAEVASMLHVLRLEQAICGIILTDRHNYCKLLR